MLASVRRPYLFPSPVLYSTVHEKPVFFFETGLIIGLDPLMIPVNGARGAMRWYIVV